MFNNKDKKDKKKNNNNNNNKTMSSNNNSDKNLPSVNMISEGTTLKGTIKTNSDVRVAGVIDGEANAKGKVIVSSTGEVKGNIKAAEADIAGKVDGEIKVTNKLILRESALVEGDIYTKNLLVEEGAQINGGFNMTEDKSVSESRKTKTNGLSGSLKTEKKNTAKKEAGNKADKK